MSASQITTQSQQHDAQHCTRCGMVLPLTAVFCGKCGKRLEKTTQYTKEKFSIDSPVDLEKYRITSLMRRAPYVQLSLAMDTQQQRPVAIRDIDIQQIDISSRSRIFEALKQEYDILRQQKSKDVLPLIASFYTKNHLYSISAWPLTTGTSPVATQTSKHGPAPHIYTLQDLLQSGIGLPDEQIALNWILHLTNAVEHLHRNHIVIGTLDPSTILVNQKDYSGQPTLFPSWMLPAVQSQLQQAPNTADASPLSSITPDRRTAFFSPEAKQGRLEERSDIYSMGALLYLLITGIAPIEQSRTALQQLRSPREINPRIQNTLATIILKALSGEPSARFQSVNEFAAALLEQQGQSKVFQRPTHPFLGYNRSAEKAGRQLAETNDISDKDNNKTEQGKAAQANLETNDNTISISPIPQRLTRHYPSHISAHQQGQESLNSEHEESIVETGSSEETLQLTKEQIQESQGEKLTTAAEVVPGSEDGMSSPNTSDNTASASKGEPDTDNRQLSSKTDREEDSETQTTVADAEQNKQKPNDNIAAPLESHEQIPPTEQTQPNNSATEVLTDSENTSSSESGNPALSPSPLPAEAQPQDKREPTADARSAATKTFSALFERVKRFVLDGQPRTNRAVAIIETPMRIQPNKNYTIRIHIMGRNEPKHAPRLKQSNDTVVLGGLGSIVQGERIHIEVRSALYHNYAYIVQQTDVEVPAANYAAEVTIPMRSMLDSAGTKRERLHIFFTDQKHNPLYEKPFVIELFISSRVPPGQEGYNVLSIPL